jgi:hypothetical protein
MLQFHTPPPAGVAPGAPAAVVARGADPSVDVPGAPAHFFRRIANLPLQAPPGALFPVASLVPLSIVEGIGGAALNTGADVGIRQVNFLLRGVFPEKIDAAIAQLEAEPAGVGLDPAASYESPSHAASAVLAAVARVAQRVRDGSPLHPAYVLNQQDFYDHEIMAPNTLAGLVTLSQPPNGLCLSHLEGDGNFLLHYGTLAFSCYGRCLGARQLALGRPATDELKRLLNLSKPLSRAIDILNTGPDTRHKLVADAFVADRTVGGLLEPVTDEEIKFHTTMPEEMSKAILRGAFDEIDFVQLLRLLIAVQRPNNVIAPYASAWYDPHFVPLIVPHLERMSALLGLPSVLVPGTIPAPLPAVFGTLSAFATTIARQHAEIVGVPSAFSAENLVSLSKFTAQVFPEAARRFQFYYSCADPAGPLPLSLFESPSAAVACLNTLQKAIKSQEAMATNEKAIYGIASEVAVHGSIEAYVNHLIAGKRRAPSPSPSRSDPPSKKASRSGKEKVKEQDDRSGSRSPSRGRDDGRGSRSRDRSPSPGAIGSRKSAVQHSADGTGFWYQDPEGNKASPVYSYDVLEKLAGKSRHELDFPVILSNKATPQARATLCAFEGKPGHEHASSSAHMPPYGDYVAKVHQLFGQPTSSRASTSARPRP